MKKEEPLAWFGHLGFGCDSSDWSERVLEVGEVGVDHVREREKRFYFYHEKRTETEWKGKKKYRGQPKLKINVIKLIKNK
jgi:hypothetical protein